MAFYGPAEFCLVATSALIVVANYALGSCGAGAAEYPRWQEDDSSQQFEDSTDRDSHDPERQQDQPHNRIKDQRQ
jgi:hypothetical protein